MSKSVSKILVICAMVVLFPLLIVGSALAAYHSIDNTVNLEVYLIDGLESQDANQFAKVTYGKQSGKILPVAANHLSSIEVGVDASSEYQWKGWFKGTKEQYKAAKESAEGVKYLSNESKTITINMKDEDTYLAVFEVVQYNMTYSYMEDPATETVTTGSVEGFPTTLVYGAALPNGEELPLTNDNFYFTKWTYGGETVTNAKFSLDEKDITLVANYSEVGTADVSLVAPAGMLVGKDGEITLSTEPKWVLGEEKTLMTPAEAVAAYNEANPENTVSLAPGYRYFWTVNDEEATTYKPEAEGAVEIVLDREEIVYSAVVTATQDNKDLMKDGDLPVGSVAYSLSDKSEVADLLNIEAKRSYNKVSGIKINGELCADENAINTKLNEVINNNGTEGVSIEVVMTNYFNKVSFAKVVYTTEDVGHVKQQDGMTMGDASKPVGGESNFKMEDTINTVFDLERNYVDAGNNHLLTLEYFEIGVQTEGSREIDGVSVDTTIEELIEILYNNNKDDFEIELDDTFEIAEIQFVFVEA